MIARCPNIAFAMEVVSKYMANPRKKHWEAMEYLIMYLNVTKGLCICFGGKEANVIGYTHVNYSRNVDNRKFTSSYVFTFIGGAISWISRLYKCKVMSNIEEEYVAESASWKEAIWLTHLVGDMGITVEVLVLNSDI